MDTADVDEIREIASWGILDGVTTNPSLIKKAVETSSKLLQKLPLSVRTDIRRSDGDGY